MTEAMPFLQKAILLSYDPRPLTGGIFVSPFHCALHCALRFAAALMIVITSSKTKPATQHNQT